MTVTFNAHFDGSVLVPDQPIELPVGQTLTFQLIAKVDSVPPFADLTKFAAELVDSPTDLAKQHDHYLYGTPKK